MDNVIFVAEFTTNHMGNLNVLLKMVEKAAQSGAHYIKMQKKDVHTYYSKEKLAQPYLSPYGKTYGDYRELFEFNKEDMARFDRACRENNIRWFCTVQDVPSLHFIEDFNPAMYKVASTNIANQALIDEIVSNVPRDKTLVVSTGGSTLEQIDHLMVVLQPFQKLNILHCVSEYPCSDEHCRLGNIPVLQKRYGSDRVSIGYSGHEEGYVPSLAAVSLGATMIERHFCLSRHSFVHHIECSLEPQEFSEMVATVKNAKDAEALKAYQRELLPVALDSHFGMSEKEKDFLVHQKYGTRYLSDKAEMHE